LPLPHPTRRFLENGVGKHSRISLARQCEQKPTPA
jgi:hypothetical protein